MKECIRNIFLGDSGEVDRNSIFWNMVFSILSAFQSAIMIMVVARINGTEVAGILSIAFATAYLMYTVGTYGVRNFQATDSQGKYFYNDYRKIRFLTCGIMVFTSLAYCFEKNYGGYKVVIILLVCALKLEEAIEDLYHGELQRAGRLDIAGRTGAFRISISDIVFVFLLLLTKNLVLALLFMNVLSLIIVLSIKYLLGDFFEKKNAENKRSGLLKLLVTCFPLFVMSFLSIYISNVPKYAIDIYLSEKEQAYYAIISMPVFTINLLSGIVYRPKLLRMAELWNEGNIVLFKKLIWRQIKSIVFISIMIIVGGITIGLKMLELLYGVSLALLKMDFAVLLVGGGVVAIYNFLAACLTIIRKQVFMFVASIFIMLLARIIANPIIQYVGLSGAAYLYFILMAGEMTIISVILFILLHKRN